MQLMRRIRSNSPHMMSSSIQKVPSEVPPKAVFLGKKSVTFDCERDHIVEYEAHIPRSDRSCVWWEGWELEEFRYKRQHCGDNDTSSIEAYNHTRQVLLHYDSYKQMETKGNSELLRDIARKSSKKSRDRAHRKAVMLSKANATNIAPKSYIFLDARLADYYMESFMDMLEKNWLCGNLSKLDGGCTIGRQLGKE